MENNWERMYGDYVRCRFTNPLRLIWDICTYVPIVKYCTQCTTHSLHLSKFSDSHLYTAGAHWPSLRFPKYQIIFT